MSEGTTEAERGPEGIGARVEPAAVSLALAGASRHEADAFLRDQRKLIALQAQELSHELDLRHWSLMVRHVSGVLKLALELSAGLLLLALVAGASALVWNAAHSDSDVIESFAVPPELAERGLTGEVVAARLLDRLQVVQTPPPSSVSAAQTVSTSSSDNVKVEIPETGVSLGELYRFLRRWLGHETTVSGEVVRQDKDIVVAVRVNGAHGATFQGPESDFDALLQKAAEHVFATVQPVRYGTFLLSQIPPRDDEALALYQRLVAETGARPDWQAGAWNGLALSFARTGDLRQSLSLLRRARQTDPTFTLGFTNAVIQEIQMSHPEAALAQLPPAQTVFEKNHDFFSPAAVANLRGDLHAMDAALHGDYARAVTEREAAMATLRGERRYFELLSMATDRAQMHDGGVIGWLAEQPRPALAPFFRLQLLMRPFQIEAALQHWQRVITLTAEAENTYEQLPHTSVAGREYVFTAMLHPWAALAKARTGDIAAAQSLIAPAPSDCYDCARIRGMIASQARQRGQADIWFAKAVAGAPSIPMAYQDWGRSLLDRGKPDDAIAQFTLADQKGPHFADPLEGWGEALMAKNQSHLTLAKFAEAEKYAPNWGRLHLKWGEALAFSGKRDEAKAHFARAAALDLTPSEKSELARMRHV